MNKYKVVITTHAQKQLDKIPIQSATQLLHAIKGLEENPRPVGSKKLRDREGYRFRVGSYRIIYDIIDKILLVEVIKVGHRRDIYG